MIGTTLLLTLTSLLAAPASAQSPARTMEVRLLGFECGDNCWLWVRRANGRPDALLCNAPQCETWMRQGRLPKALVGKRARVSVRPGKAMSGDVVMADADQVTRLTILP